MKKTDDFKVISDLSIQLNFSNEKVKFKPTSSPWTKPPA